MGVHGLPKSCLLVTVVHVLGACWVITCCDGWCCDPTMWVLRKFMHSCASVLNHTIIVQVRGGVRRIVAFYRIVVHHIFIHYLLLKSDRSDLAKARHQKQSFHLVQWKILTGPHWISSLAFLHPLPHGMTTASHVVTGVQTLHGAIRIAE